MKKYYSILLMAAAMLISTNLKAVEYEADTQDLLQQYLDEADNGDLIKLTGDIHLTSQLYFYREKGTKITLDLNGKTIDNNSAAQPKRLVRIYRGELLITSSNGTGYIRQNAYEGVKTTTYLLDILGTAAQGKEAENHTVVTIDENVTLVNNCHAIDNGKETAYGYGISILELRNNATSAYFMKDRNQNVIPNYVTVFPMSNGSASNDGLANGIVLTVKGRIEASKYCIKVNGYVRTPNYLLDTYKYTNTKYKVVEIANPTVTGTNFIALGSEGDYDLADADAAMAAAPKVTIAATAELEGMANVSNSTSVYASGLGSWTIEGTVTGNTPVWIRTGNVTIDGATIQSTSTVYQAVDAARSGSGTDAIGSAIVIETNASYSNESSLTIKGDAIVEANTGYAIEEAIHNNAGGVSEVSAINLEGGSFTGGTEGLIHITTSTIDNEVTTITGGNYNGYNSDDESTITDIVTGSNNYTTVVDNGQGKQPTLVVGQGTEPQTVAATFSFEDIDPLDSVSVDLSEITGGTVLTLDAEKTILKDLVMNGSNAVTIRIEEGKTLEVRQLTMSAAAKIIVEAGAKLIVYGSNGITANSVDNIIIEAQEGKMAQFLFNPAVSSNRHPDATVQLRSKAYKSGSTYIWQRFGLPSYTSMKRGDIIKPEATAFQYFDATVNQWKNVTADFDMQPFEGYILTINTNNPGGIYKFPCKLYGNVDANLHYGAGWNYYANSYTADIDIAALLSILRENTDKIQGAVHVNTPSATSNQWETISADDIEDGDYDSQPVLAPMQAYAAYLYDGTDLNAGISYETAIWNPAMGISNAAPARHIVDNNLTKVVIAIESSDYKDKITLRQSDRFSSEFDNGADVNKLMQDGLNVYTTSEMGNLTQFASNNIIGQTITIDAEYANAFKMTFKNLRGEQLAIRDNVTGSVINMTQDAEYFFTAEGLNEARFEIVAPAHMPTAVETLDAAPAKKGIYSLVGTYLGEDFEVLPKGIYVVDGVKVVK